MLTKRDVIFPFHFFFVEKAGKSTSDTPAPFCGSRIVAKDACCHLDSSFRRDTTRTYDTVEGGWCGVRVCACGGGVCVCACGVRCIVMDCIHSCWYGQGQSEVRVRG